MTNIAAWFQDVFADATAQWTVIVHGALVPGAVCAIAALCARRLILPRKPATCGNTEITRAGWTDALALGGTFIWLGAKLGYAPTIANLAAHPAPWDREGANAILIAVLFTAAASAFRKPEQVHAALLAGIALALAAAPIPHDWTNAAGIITRLALPTAAALLFMMLHAAHKREPGMAVLSIGCMCLALAGWFEAAGPYASISLGAAGLGVACIVILPAARCGSWYAMSSAGILLASTIVIWFAWRGWFGIRPYSGAHDATILAALAPPILLWAMHQLPRREDPRQRAALAFRAAIIAAPILVAPTLARIDFLRSNADSSQTAEPVDPLVYDAHDVPHTTPDKPEMLPNSARHLVDRCGDSHRHHPGHPTALRAGLRARERAGEHAG